MRGAHGVHIADQCSIGQQPCRHLPDILCLFVYESILFGSEGKGEVGVRLHLRSAEWLTLSHSVKVFRVQLPAGNPFYEVEKPEDQSLLQRFRDKQCKFRKVYETAQADCARLTDLNFCPTCKMQHEQPCHAKPWQEWVIDTGPEELDADGDPANTNGELPALSAREQRLTAWNSRYRINHAISNSQQRRWHTGCQRARYKGPSGCSVLAIPGENA